MESSSLKLFNDALEKVRNGRMDAVTFDDTVQKQLLPPWNGAEQALRKLRVLSGQKELVGRLVQYMSLRADAWSLTEQMVNVSVSLVDDYVLLFEPLFARLSDRYHLVAPDYPGFGHSDWPDPKQFAYTFDHIAEIMNHFAEALGLSRYTLYMQDYGGPVGFRMALAHPGRVEALIVQDAVAHNEGLGANWKTRRAFWADRAANESALRANLLSMAATRTRHVGSDPNVERYDPDLWTDEFAFLNQPGQADIQSDLFYDYRNNVEAYPKWQAWMREKQPRLLVIWGKYELSFDPSEPGAYRRDVPKAEVQIVNGGHFALDTAANQIAQFVRKFMK